MTCICCSNEAEPGKRRCDRCLKINRRAGEKYRQRKKSEGICQSCTKPVAKDSVFCEEHLIIRLAVKRKHKRKRMDEGRCYTCGRPRISEGLGAERWSCPMCRDKQEFNRIIGG